MLGISNNLANRKFKPMKSKKGTIASIILFFAALTSIYAQPIFTAANCFSIGDSTGMGSGAATAMISDEIALTGSDYTWDYSAYDDGGPIYSWTSPIHPYVIQAGTEAQQLQFQNFPIYENPGNTGLAYSRGFSYSNDSDTLYLHAQGDQGSIITIYNPPVPYLSFPLNFQEVGFADFTNYYSTIPVSSTHREWKYDGFGKIILPYGVIDSVYRIHTFQRDSSFVLSFVTTLNELIWFKKSTGIPVLRFTENSGGGFTSFYTSDVSQPTVIEKELKNHIRVYPNPTDTELRVETFESKLGEFYQILDFTGKLYNSGRVVSDNFVIDVSHLPAGLYVIRIEETNSKFIKR